MGGKDWPTLNLRRPDGGTCPVEEGRALARGSGLRKSAPADLRAVLVKTEGR